MGFVDDNLMSGERIIYRTRIHWSVFIMPSILTAAVLLAFLGKTVLTILAVLSAISGISWLSMAFITYKTSEFAVTNKRVLIKIGLIRRESLETLLQKVEGIHVEQGIVGRMFDYGTIIVKGTGGTSNPFKTIQAPFEFRKKVQEQVEISLGQNQASGVGAASQAFCTYCGAGLQAGVNFCGKCGKPVA